jgi:hypothetical protein
MRAKKGLHTKTIVIYDTESDYDFELFVTYEFLDLDINDEDDFFHFTNDDIDIKSYISNNDEEIPDWITDEMVYDSLMDELQNGHVDDEYDDEYENNEDVW